EPATNQIIALLQSNNDEDAYIRHAASLALARMGKPEPIAALSTHSSRAVRMGAVLALRRMSHPGIANFLNDADEYIVTEAARAINDDFSIEPALAALGNVLQNNRFSQEPLIRRAINANLRVGNEQAMQNLINFSTREGNAPAMRAEAVAALSTWAKPSVVDRVDGRYRGVIERDAGPVQQLASAPLVQLANHRNVAIKLSAVKALGKLRIEQGTEKLFALLKNDGNPEVRETALRSLAILGNKQIGKAIEQALSDREKSVRVAGLDLMASMDIEKDLMVNLLTDVIEKRSIEEKQAALVTLGTLPVQNTQPTFDMLLTRMANGKLPPEIHLELAEAISSTNAPELQTRLDEIRSKISPDIKMASYQDALYGGNQQNGRELAFRHQSANCMKCHSYNDYGGNAGPRFNGIGARLTRQQLLEALIDPSKRIAPGFGVVVLDLNTGKSVSGILQEENNNSVSIKIGSRPDTVIMKENITKRINAGSSMPDMKNFLTKREIRDLVSFLSTIKDEEIRARRNEETGHGE
ncbi:MAG: HEAT repeat domain-containing protein, partial [Bacteroidota bacterium]|nr:HEAT repeat domain-containing protein [Bacteroidota bacterium]